MKHRYASKSALFLMELLIAILVFTFTAAICMRIFTFAKLTADSAGELSVAVTSVQNAAECYKAYHGDLELVKQELGQELVSSDGYIEYNVNDNLILKITPDAETPKIKCSISVHTIDGEEIYAVNVGAVTEVR
jgi:hypothetical protein